MNVSIFAKKEDARKMFLKYFMKLRPLYLNYSTKKL